MADNFKTMLRTYRRPETIVSSVERHLLSRPPWEDREKKVIHPSEVVNDDFCPRSVYLRVTTGRVYSDTNLIRETIFAAGHQYHHKWQGWIWDVGKLEGLFECLVCSVRTDRKPWWDVSPSECPECFAPRRALRFCEVPVRLDRLTLAGRGDGIIYDGGSREWLEIKSVGPGSLRMLHTKLILDHTHEIGGRKVVDWEGVWRGLKRPIPDHILQTNLYGVMANEYYEKFSFEYATILYENKSTGLAKPFRVRLDPGLVEPYLDRVRELHDDIRLGTLPDCPRGGCKECEPYATTDRSEGEDGGGGDRAGEAGGGGVPDTPAPTPRSSRAARRRNRVGRSDADEPVLRLRPLA